MKWLYILFAMLGGLGLGYLLFGGNEAVPVEEHQHDMTATAGGAEIWTCSMHPQIRQPEPGICPICEMDLIPLDQNMSDDPLVLKMTEQAVALARIATTEVGTATATGDTLELNGKIKADERRAASQVAHVPGRIEQLFVTFTGERVKAGQKLATVYSPELVTAQKELLEALRFAGTNMDLAEASRQKLRNWKIDEATIQQIQSSGEIISNVTIYADRAGVVMDKRVNVGDYIKQGEALFTLADLGRLWVLFDAYEEDLANIKVGDRVLFSTPALPGRKFTASLSFIDPLINAGTRVAATRAEINNPGGVLKPEMFVRGQIALRRGEAGAEISVPKTAVLWTGDRSVVYVEVPNMEVPSYEYREVTLGDRVGNQYLIREGLQPGDRVVTNGAFSIDAAAQLNNQLSMMNRDVQVQGQDMVMEMAVPDYRAETPSAFKEQVGALALAYLALKDAFVNTDPQAVTQAAGNFRDRLEGVDMMLLKGDAHTYWMQQLEALDVHSRNMIGQEEIEAQRRQFDFLSQALIHTVKAFGAEGEALYVQHCPMAFDNEGADWISNEETIRNPYFGEKMMKCGSVLEQLTD
ncbi:efflux RND transporter periplasmic adaptor subunit [Flavilitoribacter nigricans]|uniref:Efflux transporter periplasmic adaptor subunit n=1 Tax=Flavilitoribacter nigricans (strain ATCC 23147 / DSM 23189 / NBRC 102662 / NCIMB 1420 / SS-2) TaxID=1122177 RepID=A0A2D0N5U5_FLAN2|nr:efflux RND transporter periplasmic adaptor subunit [Flavilitoribacter nigricans]PHN03529.1 efflux transporter periplasmic adaptor subunit [Flavilitoribacter nigricans DSM 23189 = NBRC 102662]